jgi:hypothetical protein
MKTTNRPSAQAKFGVKTKKNALGTGCAGVKTKKKVPAQAVPE